MIQNRATFFKEKQCGHNFCDNPNEANCNLQVINKML